MTQEVLHQLIEWTYEQELGYAYDGEFHKGGEYAIMREELRSALSYVEEEKELNNTKEQ